MDIDALLDDVEGILDDEKKTTRRPSNPKQRRAAAVEFDVDDGSDLPQLINGGVSSNYSYGAHLHQQKLRKSSTPLHHDEHDIDSLLNDLETTMTTIPSKKQVSTSLNKQQSKVTTSATITTESKCTCVVLTDARIPKGICTSTSQRCVCCTLRCTSCDHAVCSFDDVKWDDTANNTPNYNKLKVLLLRLNGARAYACQCAWASILAGEEKVLVRGCAPPWVCGRHKPNEDTNIDDAL